MLWKCGNSFVFYFLMEHLPGNETRGIALRGIIVMKYLVFVVPRICLFILALWHGIDVVYRKYDTICYYLRLTCYRFAYLSSSDGGRLFSTDVSFWFKISLRTKTFKEKDNHTEWKEREAHWVACSGCPGMGWKKTNGWTPWMLFFFKHVL